MNRKGFINGMVAVAGTAVLPPKAFSGSSIKSAVSALEAFVDERVAAK